MLLSIHVFPHTLTNRKTVGLLGLIIVVLLCLTNQSRHAHAMRTTIKNRYVGEFLSHLEFDNSTGMFYVGGMNRVYLLDKDLHVVDHAVTGPREDSYKCLPPPRDDCVSGRRITNNYNKILLIERSQRFLITCGSVYQGACETRSLSNLSDCRTYYMADDVTDFAVAANDQNASTVAFITPGLATNSHQVLFVATTYTDRSRTHFAIYRDRVPAICSRSLRIENRFALAAISNPLTGMSSSMYLKSEVSSHFLIEYVTGFSYRGFSYFMTVQKETVEEFPVQRSISKIVQICQGDPDFNSYVDIPVVCKIGPIRYNVLEAAEIAYPGSMLAESFGLFGDVDNEVLVAAFSNRDRSRDAYDSAICVYNMKDVRLKFLENVKLCHHGNASVSGGGYLRVGRSNCNQPSGLVLNGIEDGYQYMCNTRLERFTNVVGTQPIERSPVIEFQGERLTAVKVTVVHDHTVVLAGTSSGRLKKVEVFSPHRAQLYSDQLIVDGSLILKDMRLDQDQQHIFLLTRTNITKVALQNCPAYGTCDACLNDRDPYCGWCSLENRPCGITSFYHDAPWFQEKRGEVCKKAKISITPNNITLLTVGCPPRCAVKSDCLGSKDQSKVRWLQGSSSQCIYITAISPHTASVTRVTELKLTIPLLPQRHINYSCVYLDFNVSTSAQLWYLGAVCKTPDFYHLGISLTDEGYHTITLALNSSETGKLFVMKSFTLYNCSSFKTCSQCTNSKFDCSWCVYRNGCYHDTDGCLSNVIASRSSSKPGQKGPIFCPRIDTELTNDIYLHVGVPKTILLKGYNFPPPTVESVSYKCVVNTGSAIYQAQAELLDDHHITCSMPEMYYDGEHGILAADLSVYWGNDFYLESSKGLLALLYKCDVLANDDCSLCLNLNFTRSYLECYWCDGRCRYLNSCGLTSAALCPPPHIKSVWPLSGPIQGETNVTIEGTNLGSKFEDIVHSIFVANTKCAPYRSLYSASRRIVCRTGWKGSVHSGPVEIRLTGEPVIQSSETFSYKSPTIFSIHPQNGPISGGSRVTIFGHDLDTGAQLRAVLGDSPCIIDRGTLTPDSVVCLTTHVLWPAVKRPVRLAFDGTFVTIDQQFHYREDPVIISIQPLSSIQQGGRLLTVKGSNLGFIQNPKMFAYVPMDDGRFYTTDNTMCTSVDVEEIRCPSPSLDWNHLPLPTIIHSRRRRTSSHFQIGFPQNNSNQNGGHFRVSGGQNFGTYRWRKRSNAFQPLSTSQLAFIMDGVLSLRNMTMMEGIDSKLVYYPNPFIFNFSDLDSIKVFKGEMLIIEGEGLTLAAHVADVKVWVGGEMCNVSLLSPSQIVCDPPISQPFGLGVDGRLDSSVLPLVVVFVNSKRYEVGWLKYNIPEVFHFPVEATAGIAAGGGILLVLILLILLVYRRQRCRSERIYRKLQIQLDNLESNVRNECKQAFAELQTDMTDLTSDLTSSGIPFWDYHTYTFKVLFPHLSSHAILHPLLQKNGNLRLSEHGLQLFHQLLNKKIFLLAFIRMLDNQRTFSMRDKARVASLLIIVYQNNMEYITDILKVLLKDLIRKSVLDRHPKLMFRRSESVVEKLLTNWLSLCLYTHLKDHAGASLFMLYKAIKLQVEKGPVDVVTGDARYSLSEDRLLREKIEPKILMLNVEHGVEMVQCRVLDCDTVTQVKEKILEHLFKNVPFSQRPCMDDLELEWRNGPTGPLTLCDEDIASHNSSGWRRLNTLGYYNVRNDAYMSLLYRQHTYKTLNGTFDHTLLMSMAGNNYPTKSARGDEGKVWHLVKHDDTHMKDGGYKMISEIFLTRLLSTKGILQKYIDDLFTIVLSVNNVPPTVKFIFDFLDSEALHHGVTDPEVVHTWKCNTVVGQTFMDSCSTSEHRLGKDSPSNKLLFAKDIVQYRKLVEKYLTVIRLLPPITDHEMSLHLSGVSRMCSGKFYISSALRDLYSYLSTFRNEMLYTLEQDSQATAHQMSVKLGHVIATMEGPSSPMAYV